MESLSESNFDLESASATAVRSVFGSRSALVVAHPGHELCIHGWLELATPMVSVLTDGSGRSWRSRLGSTSKVLEAAGAREGPVFGDLTDREVYASILAGEVDGFSELVRRLAASIDAEEVDSVVGDPLEGYNPAHDLCRVMIEAAIELSTRQPKSYDFALTDPLEPADAATSFTLTLNDLAFERKTQSSHDYSELTGEVQSAVKRESLEAFRREHLRVVRPDARTGEPPSFPPFYETHGERRVAAGRYGDVLRWREHLEPLVRRLRSELGLPRSMTNVSDESSEGDDPRRPGSTASPEASTGGAT